MVIQNVSWIGSFYKSACAFVCAFIHVRKSKKLSLTVVRFVDLPAWLFVSSHSCNNSLTPIFKLFFAHVIFF